MNSTKKQAPRFRVGDWVAFDYGSRKVSAKVIEDRGPLGVRGRRIHRVQFEVHPNQSGDNVSGLEMPENDLELAPTPVRQVFEVRYRRQGKSRIWRAGTRDEGLFRGLNPEGAVGYTTGMWEGESADDLGRVTVTVWLEADSGSDEEDMAAPLDVRLERIRQAQTLADEMFLIRHPRARIEHVLDILS